MSQIEVEPIASSAAAKKPSLTEFSPQSLYDKCVAIAHNLWWTWHPDVINLFRDLDPIRWRQLDHNPIAVGGIHARAVGNAGGRVGTV